MRARRSRVLLILVAAALLAACEAGKSANPLSPSVAGPMPGVTISAPKPLEPNTGWNVNNDDQPVTLLLENSSTNSPRPITYRFEVATDAGLTSLVFSRDGVAPGDGGRTRLRLPDRLQSDRTYYWRARAEDGVNTGPYSNGVNFNVFTPVKISAPVPIAPTGDAVATTRQPAFTARNAERSGPAGPLSYVFDISTNESFTSMIAIVTVAEQPNETGFTIAQELDYDTRIYWRVRAYDPSTTGPHSAIQTFRTPSPPPPPPPPPPPAPAPAPAPTPPPSPGPGAYPNNGPDVVKYVAERYPQYLVAGVSLAQRNANMEFLRDRVIEVGICGGMDLAWNLKRGVGPKSIDAIAWRTNGKVEVVDIGAAYDDTSQPLRLQWGIVGGPAGWSPYPPFTCQ